MGCFISRKRPKKNGDLRRIQGKRRLNDYIKPMSVWPIRIFFMCLCTVAGYAVSQYRPEIIEGGTYGMVIGFGLGGVLIGIDHMLKGFSLRAFSAATFGLMLGALAAWLVDRTELFIYADEKTRWVVRLGLFL